MADLSADAYRLSRQANGGNKRLKGSNRSNPGRFAALIAAVPVFGCVSMFCQCAPATLPAVEYRSYKRLGLEAAFAVVVALLVGALAAYVAAGGSLFVV